MSWPEVAWALAACSWSTAAVDAQALARSESADTLPPSAAVESEYSFSSGAVTLTGTLTRPRDADAPIPVVLLVADSGPTDRNGNAPPTVRSNLYAQLAWRLAERGIASLRYDKRDLPSARGESERARITFDESALDVKAAAMALEEDPRFAFVALAGHGEGAWLALRAANATAPAAGVALLGASGRPQLEVVQGRLDTDAAFNPLVEIAHAPTAVLIVHGRRDAEVGEHDADRLFGARLDARFVVLPDANHFFKRAWSAGRDTQRSAYLDPTTPVVPELVRVLVEWVAALF